VRRGEAWSEPEVAAPATGQPTTAGARSLLTPGSDAPPHDPPGARRAGRLPRVSALYRKYRPQDLSEVVGQQHVVRTLRNAIEHDRVRHAYLFAGPRGTAKTSLARILAKSLNCQTADAPTITPCRQCESCRTIQETTALDVIELDAASNRGIDDIREIRDRVALRPVLGRRKVYILDEAHSLTTDASNALLKTLEEPPDHVVFVLCTTEPQKLLDTIKGRCQAFSFLRPTVEELRGVVTRIADAEGFDVDDASLGLIARHARGSFRDAVSGLDQLATALDGSLRADDVRRLLGTVDEAVLLQVVERIVAQDAAALLVLVDELVEGGQDVGQLIADLSAHLRLLLLTKEIGAPPASAPITPEHAAAVMVQAAELDERTLVQGLEGLVGINDELREGGDPRLPLELLLVKLARPRADRGIDTILRRLDALERGAPAPAPAPPAAAPAPVEAAPPPPPPAPAPAAPAAPAAQAADEPQAAVAVAEPVAPPAPVDVDVDAAELERLFRFDVLAAVRERKPALAPALEPAHAAGIEHGALRIAYPASAAFQRARAESDANRAVLAEVLGEVFGQRLRVRFETVDTPAAPSAAPVAPAPAAAPAPEAAADVTADAQEADPLDRESALIAGLIAELDAHEIEEDR
jgi:DNA polymerase III subunit gamma/tau